MLRKDAELREIKWKRALREIANQFPEGSPERKLFGSMAWGRHAAEGGPDRRAGDVFYSLGYLEGYRDAALLASELFELASEEPLRSIHRRMGV